MFTVMLCALQLIATKSVRTFIMPIRPRAGSESNQLAGRSLRRGVRIVEHRAFACYCLGQRTKQRDVVFATKEYDWFAVERNHIEITISLCLTSMLGLIRA